MSKEKANDTDQQQFRADSLILMNKLCPAGLRAGKANAQY